MRGMDFWETVRRRRLDRGGHLKKLRGDWLRLLSDTFETDQSDCCTTRGFRWILLGGVFRKLQESDWMKLQIFFSTAGRAAWRQDEASHWREGRHLMFVLFN